jgi:hypothetical protein
VSEEKSIGRNGIADDRRCLLRRHGRNYKPLVVAETTLPLELFSVGE